MHENTLNKRLKQIYKYYNVMFINNDSNDGIDYTLSKYDKNTNKWISFNNIIFDLQNVVIKTNYLKHYNSKFITSKISNISSNTVTVNNISCMYIYCDNLSTFSKTTPLNVATKHYIDYIYTINLATTQDEALNPIDVKLGHVITGSSNIYKLKDQNPGVAIAVVKWSGNENYPGNTEINFLGYKTTRYIAGYLDNVGQYHFANSSFIIVGSNNFKSNTYTIDHCTLEQPVMIRSQYITPTKTTN